MNGGRRRIFAALSVGMLTVILVLVLPSPVRAADAYSDEVVLRPLVTTESCDVTALATGDTDGDGSTELVVACYEGSVSETYGVARLFVYGYLGGEYLVEWSSGQMVASDELGEMALVKDLVLYDADGDGRDDIFVLGWIHDEPSVSDILLVYSWRSSGYDLETYRLDSFEAIAFSDGDLDGETEMYAASLYSGWTEYEMEGFDFTYSHFYSTDEYVADISVTDIDSDLKPEIVLGSRTYGLSFFSYEWNGSGYVQDHALPSLDYAGGVGHETGDFDSDGATEVALLDILSTVLVVEWNGTSFAEDWSLDATGDPVQSGAFTTGDADGDGQPEMIVSRITYDFETASVFGGIHVYGYDGGSYCIEWSSETYETAAVSIAVGDIEGDGSNSIIAGHASTGVVRIIVPASEGSPHAELSVEPECVIVGVTVSFDATDSYDDEDGTDLEFRWDWECDGIWDLDWTTDGTVEHSYTVVGDTAAMVQVRDSDDLTDLETVLVRVMEMDTDPPWTVISRLYSYDVGDNGWYLSSLSISLYAIDNSSGVQATYTKVDDGDWTASTYVYFGSETWSNLSYYSVDALGNVEDVKTLEVKIDEIPPWTSILCAGERGSAGWYTSAVSVTLVSTDLCSGVNYTLYSINGGVWNTYEGPFILSESGKYAVEYYSFDNAGQVGMSFTNTVSIDMDGPEVTVSEPLATIAESDNVTLLCEAYDENGIDRIEVYYDGDGPMVYYSSTVNITIPDLKAGAHTVTVVAYDTAGNSREAAVSFSVAETDGRPLDPWMLLSAIAAAAAGAIALAYYMIMVRPSPPVRPPPEKR